MEVKLQQQSLYEDRHRFSERTSILIGAQTSTYLAKRNSLKKGCQGKGGTKYMLTLKPENGFQDNATKAR